MKTFILLYIILFFTACQEANVYNDYKSFQNEEWCWNNKAKFDIEIDQSGDYSMNLCVRHTTDYELANLWCFISVRDSSRYLLKDTLNIKLAESDGRWLGTGYSLKTLDYPMPHPRINLPAGKYHIEIEQVMRIQCLTGIKDIGVTFRPAKKY